MGETPEDRYTPEEHAHIAGKHDVESDPDCPMCREVKATSGPFADRGTLYAHVVIRRREWDRDRDVTGGPFVLVVDADPKTAKGFAKYGDALFEAIRILAAYGGWDR